MLSRGNDRRLMRAKGCGGFGKGHDQGGASTPVAMKASGCASAAETRSARELGCSSTSSSRHSTHLCCLHAACMWCNYWSAGLLIPMLTVTMAKPKACIYIGSHPDPCLQVVDLLRVALCGLADQDARCLVTPVQLSQQVTNGSKRWVVLLTCHFAHTHLLGLMEGAVATSCGSLFRAASDKQ